MDPLSLGIGIFSALSTVVELVQAIEVGFSFPEQIKTAKRRLGLVLVALAALSEAFQKAEATLDDQTKHVCIETIKAMEKNIENARNVSAGSGQHSNGGLVEAFDHMEVDASGGGIFHILSRSKHRTGNKSNMKMAAYDAKMRVAWVIRNKSQFDSLMDVLERDMNGLKSVLMPEILMSAMREAINHMMPAGRSGTTDLDSLVTTSQNLTGPGSCDGQNNMPHIYQMFAKAANEAQSKSSHTYSNGTIKGSQVVQGDQIASNFAGSVPTSTGSHQYQNSVIKNSQVSQGNLYGDKFFAPFTFQRDSS